MFPVHKFAYSDADILQSLNNVFSGRGTASEQWSAQAELLLEPVGWNALWKLSKESCKKFDVRYPCIAYIAVTSVDFEELSANVEILSVQHEKVTLPERVADVPLIDLWPTVKQEEDSIDIESTAEFIDLLRFFYQNIWMPWDDQDGKVVLPKTIENRLKLWMELNNGTIPCCVSRTIKMLRNSAVNTHEKLRELDSPLCDEDITDEDDSLLPSNYIALTAELSAKLDILMSKWTLYEDPLVREQYLIKAKNKWQDNKCKRNVVALWQGGDITEFKNISNFLQTKLSNEHNLKIMESAKKGLSLDPEEVIICSKHYEIPEIPLSHISLCSLNGTTLVATDMRSCLFMLSEECKLKDLTLQCSLVNTVIMMQAGSLHISNCTLLDDVQSSQSDCAQGIVANSGVKIFIEDCTFQNFYTGIVVHAGAEVIFRRSVIKNCGVGIQMYYGSRVKMDATIISECSEQSIRYEMDPNSEMDGLEWTSNCQIGSGDTQKEVFVVRQDIML